MFACEFILLVNETRIVFSFFARLIACLSAVFVYHFSHTCMIFNKLTANAMHSHNYCGICGSSLSFFVWSICDEHEQTTCIIFNAHFCHHNNFYCSSVLCAFFSSIRFFPTFIVQSLIILILICVSMFACVGFLCSVFFLSWWPLNSIVRVLQQ